MDGDKEWRHDRKAGATMFMNRWLVRHEIIELNDLVPWEQEAVFAVLKPFHGEGGEERFLESDADTVIGWVRSGRPLGSSALYFGREEDKTVVEMTVGPLMRTKEAAEHLAISERQLQYEAGRGNVRCVRFGKGCIRFAREDLDEYVNRHRTTRRVVRGN